MRSRLRKLHVQQSLKTRGREESFPRSVGRWQEFEVGYGFYNLFF
jgi:hypothetical protein